MRFGKKDLKNNKYPKHCISIGHIFKLQVSTNFRPIGVLKLLSLFTVDILCVLFEVENGISKQSANFKRKICIYTGNRSVNNWCTLYSNQTNCQQYNS